MDTLLLLRSPLYPSHRLRAASEEDASFFTQILSKSAVRMQIWDHNGRTKTVPLDTYQTFVPNTDEAERAALRPVVPTLCTPCSVHCPTGSLPAGCKVWGQTDVKQQDRRSCTISIRQTLLLITSSGYIISGGPRHQRPSFYIFSDH
uniref:Uncharacterized protein n=1 Tax=Knipowitschia caucasica TaxID=637954 RepID=A0AAV2L995_KNICA